MTDVSADGTERGFQIVGGRLLLFGDGRFVRELHTRSTRNGVPSGGRRVARIVGTWQDEAEILRLSHAPTTDPGRLHAWQYQREGGGAVLEGAENHYFNSLAVYVAMVEYLRYR